MNSVLTHHVVTRETHEDKLPETKMSVEGNRPDQEKVSRNVHTKAPTTTTFSSQIKNINTFIHLFFYYIETIFLYS